MSGDLFSPERLLDALGDKSAATGFVVAFSGGRDSSVLLHALATLRGRLPAPLRAMHINHGLHADAAAWERHCQAFAVALHSDYISRTVVIDSADSRGLEAAARAARYAALGPELRPGEWLLTAHHADDQLETVLLQLLRGGGPAGIAAMPARAPFGAGFLVRPLLEFDRQTLAAYAEANVLNCVDDPGNIDPQRDRNYLRHEIVPRLKQRWPSATITIGRAARHAAQAKSLLRDLAALDLDRIAEPGSPSLPVEAVLALGRARAGNLLRHWLKQRGLPVPDTRRLDTLLKQAAETAGDRAPQVTWPGTEARCWQGRIYAFKALDEPVELPTRWHGERLMLGSGLGQLHAITGTGGLRTGVTAEGLEVRWRQGGERIRAVGQLHHRSLKDLLREAGVVPWLRNRIPLLWFNDELVAVADLWIADEFAAPAKETGVRIEWRKRPDHFFGMRQRFQAMG
ncbi:MAG TPA: tRNA lysidine(34) synthetase TilS [Gammaproteobacteria bacterium]|nr:tRNA lysidine(34) synthetase TilS [Gammaproteobacteria bacterium]